MSDIQHYIGGKRLDAMNGRWGDVFNLYHADYDEF